MIEDVKGNLKRGISLVCVCVKELITLQALGFCTGHSLDSVSIGPVYVMESATGVKAAMM